MPLQHSNSLPPTALRPLALRDLLREQLRRAVALYDHDAEEDAND